jgi:polysaccharide export outer membrane protein
MFAKMIVRLLPQILIFVLASGCGSAPPADVFNTDTSRRDSRVVSTSKSPAPGVEPAPGSSDKEIGVAASEATFSENYRIGPQDLIEIQVYGLEGLKREVRVNSRGVISLPLIGAVALGGLTAQEAEHLIKMKYERDNFRNLQVSLFIKEFTRARITIEGAVNKPGVYPIKGQITLLQALAIAGGGSPLSDMSKVMVFRLENGTRKSSNYDVTKIRAGELEDPTLTNDDLVVVGRSAAPVEFPDSCLALHWNCRLA